MCINLFPSLKHQSDDCMLWVLLLFGSRENDSNLQTDEVGDLYAALLTKGGDSRAIQHHGPLFGTREKCQLNGALLRCGGQDSNLRTDKEWDLNPPPLTKLGDPRAG